MENIFNNPPDVTYKMKTPNAFSICHDYDTKNTILTDEQIEKMYKEMSDLPDYEFVHCWKVLFSAANDTSMFDSQSDINAINALKFHKVAKVRLINSLTHRSDG